MYIKRNNFYIMDFNFKYSYTQSFMVKNITNLQKGYIKTHIDIQTYLMNYMMINYLSF